MQILKRGLLVAVLVAPIGLAFAQKKTGKIAHPNIVAADKLCTQALAKLTAAQKANEYDLGGHAAKAKDLITQAQAEIKLANEAADEKK